MKTLAYLLSVAALTAAQQATRCNQDNCLRAIIGTRPPNTRQPRPDEASRLQDCSSFQRVTVIPAETTVTTNGVTETVTATETVQTTFVDFQGAARKRQASTDTTISPTAVPAYASCGTGTVAQSRYASACSCASITRTTITSPTPTVFVTTTDTTTTTEAVVATSTCPPATPKSCRNRCVNLQTDNANCGACERACSQGQQCQNGACVTPGPRGPSCTGPPYNQQGVGGCSSNCYCDPRVGAPNGACNDQVACNGRCNSDADCADGFACTGGVSAGPCGGTTCVEYTRCSSTFNPGSKKGRRGAVVRSFGNVVARAASGLHVPNDAVKLRRPELIIGKA